MIFKLFFSEVKFLVFIICWIWNVLASVKVVDSNRLLESNSGCFYLNLWPWQNYKKCKKISEQTIAPGILTFHVMISWHWLSTVRVSSPCTNNTAQEVCQDKGQTVRLFFFFFWYVHPTLWGTNRAVLIPEKLARCSISYGSVKGNYCPGVFKVNCDVPLAGKCCCNMSF